MSPARFSFLTMYKTILCIVAIILFSALSTSAQTSSTITGDIKDTNGAVLVGVKVTANDIETGITRSTTSEADGRFVFPGLPVGLYELHAESAGFEPLAFPNVRTTVNETTAVVLVMKVANLSAGVTVQSGEALVNTQTPELSYLVNERMIEAFTPGDVCATRIRENVKLAESPAFGLDIFRAAPTSRGAHDYAALAAELDGAGFLD